MRPVRLQIGMNVYMKHAGSFFFFLLWSVSLCLFDVKCSTANKKEYSWKRGKKREYYFSDIVLRNSEYDLTRPPSKSKPLPLMLPYSILDASSVSMKYSTIASLKIQQLWFSLEFFQLSAIVEWSNNTLAHAQISSCLHAKFRGPTSDRSESFVSFQQPEWVKPAWDDSSDRLHVNRNKHPWSHTGLISHVIRASVGNWNR